MGSSEGTKPNFNDFVRPNEITSMTGLSIGEDTHQTYYLDGTRTEAELKMMEHQREGRRPRLQSGEVIPARGLPPDRTEALRTLGKASLTEEGEK